MTDKCNQNVSAVDEVDSPLLCLLSKGHKGVHLHRGLCNDYIGVLTGLLISCIIYFLSKVIEGIRIKRYHSSAYVTCKSCGIYRCPIRG